MAPLDPKDVVKYVENNIDTFHSKRLKKLQTLKLNEVLGRKNPYLFKAKNIHEANELVKTIMDAYISSREETLFGEFLEGLAIFVAEKVHGGQKSASPGIDLDFEKDGIRYLVSIKSGPNWGNSSQIKQMIANFKTAKKILGTNTSIKNVVCINGCCYGHIKKIDKADYLKYCGQDFWEFISGNINLYKEIIEPLGYEAKKHNDVYHEEYSKLVNVFTSAFIKDFCIDDGKINWDKLVEFNSSSYKRT